MDAYFEKIRAIQESMLSFIDDENSDNENLFQLLDDYKKQSYYQHEFKLILSFILQICNHHHRNIDFFAKIDQIFSYFEKDIKTRFSNTQIFNFFKSNNRILLLLYEKEVLNFDFDIESAFYNDEDNLNIFKEYFQYMDFVKTKEIIQITEDLISGENDDEICKLIRKDSIDEFISFFNSKDYIKINQSIFESNRLLFKKNPTLIEYAAFFGSVKIFKYLYQIDHCDLEPSVWIYAIHGRNSEIIHILEDSNTSPEDETFSECLKEAIKCHHNEIAEYIQNNLLKYDENDKKVDINILGIKYYNFYFIDGSLVNKNKYFYFFGRNYYYNCFEILSNLPDIDINYKYKIDF